MEWVMRTVKDQGGLCAVCHTEIQLPQVGVEAHLDQASVDRVLDEFAHTQANCRITCRSCNFGHK